MKSETASLTVEASLQLAVSLMRDGDREWRLGEDIHALIEMDLEGHSKRLPMDEKEFVALLEKDKRFKSIGHGFFALEGVKVDMKQFNRLIAMGMFG